MDIEGLITLFIMIPLFAVIGFALVFAVGQAFAEAIPNFGNYIWLIIGAIAFGLVVFFKYAWLDQ